MLLVEMVPASEMMRIQSIAKGNATDRSPMTYAEVQNDAMQKTETATRMQWFEQELRQEISNMQVDRSVAGFAVDISLEGFGALEANPEYRRQILALIQKDIGSSYAPREAKLHIKVGKNLEEYVEQSWSGWDDTEFRKLSANSFYVNSEGAGSVHRQFESYSSRAYQDFRTWIHEPVEGTQNDSSGSNQPNLNTTRPSVHLNAARSWMNDMASSGPLAEQTRVFEA